MADIRQTAVRNNLLRLMPSATFSAISVHLEAVDLPRSFELSAPHEEADYAYFPETGIASIVARSPQGQHAEIGIFGRDGMTPAAVVLDAGSDPFSIFMQVQGDGFRISTTLLKSLLDADGDLKNLLGRYVQALSVQGAFTSLPTRSTISTSGWRGGS